MRSRELGRAALIGLLVVAAVSVTAGSGRKPAKEVQSAVSLRHISTSEAMDILQKFPELVPSWLAARRNDAEYMAGTFGFVEVTEATLARVFPAAHFYLGHHFTSPPLHPYLMAISGGKRYPMPGYINLLLLDNGQKATDKNIIKLAEAFVIAAVIDRQGPNFEVTFLGTSKTKHVISGGDYDASLKVRIGQQIEEWSFSIDKRGQLGTVYRRGPKGYIDSYDPAEARPRHGPGQLNSTPDKAVEGGAHAEADTTKHVPQPASGLQPSQAAAVAKSPEEEDPNVSLRQISPSDVMAILDKFPEMVPSYLAYVKNRELLASLYPLSEVTAVPLKRALPNVRFFKGLDTGIKPPFPYVMAIAGRKRYPMPGGLNQLLVDSDVRVTDANLVEIAKAVVVLALGNDMLGNPFEAGYVSDELLAFPKLTFLSAEMQVTGDSHSAKLRVRIGDNEESWYVPRWHDQLGWVSRGNANGLIKDYQMPEAKAREQQK